MNIDFGKKITQLRSERGVTQAAFSEVLGVSRALIHAYESGKRNPSYEKLMEIALLFGVSMDWLFGNTDNQSGTPTIDISSLNNPQINIVRELVSEFKRLNKIANVL
jgi:transcriptional regulator with XRE-family HTH domain